MTSPLLEIEGLTVSYRRAGEWGTAVSNVSLGIGGGEAYGLVGESGCGKTTLALALMRYLPRNGRIDAGAIRVEGEDLIRLQGEALRRWRGARLGMVYQDPAGALNPALRVGDQIAEVYRFHRGAGRREAVRRAADALVKVAMPDPDDLMRRYPHQLSGGQQQRVVIAMALAGSPRLLILDEPTTGLDVTIEAEIIDPSPRSAPRSTRRSCSSVTTSDSSPGCATGSASCTRAGSSRKAPRTTSSTPPATPTRWACSAVFPGSSLGRGGSGSSPSRARSPSSAMPSPGAPSTPGASWRRSGAAAASRSCTLWGPGGTAGATSGKTSRACRIRTRPPSPEQGANPKRRCSR
ncbi:MAG: ABC transporter ATP-binding protein [Bacillati bacterium ANGP1]|uniref:ABC transporter ATP-binding protein n=1 Tax=Candidatus Segetimicrobium genomatis TaxID=2569760 RepID=A0A537JDI9_9BACT|nr:MAG: ABC transporter ATP-binding protein [Terrabacteria group bacterium ANGP1]